MDQIKSLLQECLFEQTFIQIIFSNKRKKSLPYKKVTIRPITIQGDIVYQAEYHYENKVIHENLHNNEVLNTCQSLILQDFKQVNIFVKGEDIQILASKVTNPKIIRKEGTKTPGSLSHNQQKKYLIPDQTPCDFLIRLGIMGPDGNVFQKQYSKFRQINRFLEIVQDIFPKLPKDRPIKIIDFGCGKAYLTFALYHYLKVCNHQEVEITGLDLKADVIEFCNNVATDLAYEGLTFELGDIANYASDHADMVVTLHACDTATDYALINAVKWNTGIILSVPCCQHELFNQIENPLHKPLLKHGIIKDRFTELLTDGLRGLKLESKGYDVSMIEFTSLEHTSKNIMIKAVKKGKENKKAAMEYAALKEFYQVTPTIDQL